MFQKNNWKPLCVWPIQYCHEIVLAILVFQVHSVQVGLFCVKVWRPSCFQMTGSSWSRCPGMRCSRSWNSRLITLNMSPKPSPRRFDTPNNFHFLFVFTTNTYQQEMCAWPYICKAAPVLWNTLSPTTKTASSLASFKIELKTRLFKAAFL